MECTRCHTVNKISSSYCEKCGAPMRLRRRSYYFPEKSSVPVWAVLLLCAGVFAYFFMDIFPPAFEIPARRSYVEKEKQGKRMPDKGKDRAVKQRSGKGDQSAVQKNMESAAHRADMSDSDPKSAQEIAAGWVIIIDPWGSQVSKFRAGIVGSGWMALPARACFGGNQWYFYPDQGRESQISGGMWIKGDSVGLWNLAPDTGSSEGPELAGWNEEEPVSWFSIESPEEYHAVKLKAGGSRSDGYFLSLPLPAYINESGVFMQRGKVVGWSFGQQLARGYMWPGEGGTELTHKAWVNTFYNLTFAGGREEKFAMALAMEKGHDGLDQLSVFMDGFRLEPKLPREDTPSYLLPEEVIEQVRALVANAIRSGEEGRIDDMVNGQMLKRIGDIALLMDVVPAIVATRGYEAAIGEIEDMASALVQQEGTASGLSELHVKLYRDWLQSLVSSGALDEGWRAYNSAKAHFPDDPSIHLFGVELELLNGDWEEAERLLYMRNYPPSFQDWYERLARRISEMKGQEGKIVIRFPHGSSRIPVTAAINEALSQDFIVDTGASMVTIPSSTVDELGLEIQKGRHRVSTVGGVVTAGEVVIEAIEIDGWIEYEIRALVIDIPDRPGLGLLGLNYLNRFQMDLRPEEGTLLLVPR